MYSNAELFSMATKQPKELFVKNVTLSIPGDAEGCTDPDAETVRLSHLWDVARMSMSDMITATGMNITTFVKHAAIPYSSLQKWIRGERECPVYVRFFLAEHYGLI